MVYVRHLTWDAWNVAHIARHRVAPQEVEVCQSDPVVQQTYQRRLLLLGRTSTGRILAVVLAPEGRGVFYPVTARPASRRERRFYEEQKGGGTT